MRSKLAKARGDAMELKGLEPPLCNDLLLGGRWIEEKVWRWKSPKRINVQETLAAVALFKDLAIKSPRCPTSASPRL